MTIITRCSSVASRSRWWAALSRLGGLLALAAALGACLDMPTRKQSDAERCAMGEVDYCTEAACATFEPALRPPGCATLADGTGGTDDGVEADGASTAEVGPDAAPDVTHDLGPDGGCVPGAACDDGDPCTTGDTCTADGTCVGQPTPCDDGNPCTVDECDGASGACLHQPTPGVWCDDGDLCTTGDVCQADGSCGGQAKSCADTVVCTVDSCDPISGACLHDASPCQCTSDADCEDDNPCTLSRCDLATGQCDNPPNQGTVCDDGDPCTVGDACDGAGACAGSPKVCDDGNPCTSDACDPSSGACSATPTVGAACDDGSLCTTDDTCTPAGTCVGVAKVCDDGVACSVDSCVPATGLCAHDLSACQCTAATGDAVCDDGNPCTVDHCDTAAGVCTNEITQGAGCDDGNPCTTGDTCTAAGACAGQPKPCDDDNPCTTDGCDGASGACLHQPTPGVWCDDGDLCTTGDVCQADGSCGGQAKSCVDTFACTVDSCDPASGACQHDASSCQCMSDGDCDDGSPCTVGACKADGSCVQVPANEGAACGPSPRSGVCSLGTCEGVTVMGVGDAAVCVALAGGEVRCWGHNNYGQLGVGSTQNRLDEPGETTQAVPLSGPAVALSMGWCHTCAVLDSGSVQCWGWNDVGQLGAGDTEDRMDEPGEQPSTVLLDGAQATALASGGKFTCAITATGAVRCWGDNGAGQLGAGHVNRLMDGPNEHPSLVDLGGEKAVAIGAGDFFNCVVTESGKVRCWGLNDHGQLGAGNTENLMDEPGEVPSTVDLGGAVAQSVACGAWFACALTTQGVVRCWGDNARGELGAGDTVARMDKPGDTPSTVALGGKATALSAMHDHACALMDNGAVRCWGWGIHGVLGTGSTENLMDELGEEASVVPLGGQVPAALGAGHMFNCVLLEAGQVECWGYGNWGMLGYGSTANVGDTPESLPIPGFSNAMGAPGSVCDTGTQCLSGTCSPGATGGLCAP